MLTDLDNLFIKMDYTNKLDNLRKRGYKYLGDLIGNYPDNTIQDIKEIRMALAKFLFRVEFGTAQKFPKNLENEDHIFYEITIRFLENKYCFKYDPIDPEAWRFLNGWERKKRFPYKTADHVNDIIKEGFDGGLKAILGLIVS